jgi:hypothetical protein
MLLGVKPTSLTFLVCLLAGCVEARPRAVESHSSYPAPSRAAPSSLEDKDENPGSQVWPLDLWLVEFAKRNGLELRYRDRDMFGRSVVRPGPGPFDSEDDAIEALRRVARRNGLTLTQERQHVFSLKRLDGIR